jgi:hypothetical protein
VIPDLIDALVTVAVDALPEVTVCDGLPQQLNTGAYLCIGVDDWDAGTSVVAARASHEWADLSGREVDEDGTITAMAWIQTGSTDAKPARDAVFAIHAAVKECLRAAVDGAHSPDVLGVAGLWNLRVGGVDEFSQPQSEDGVLALLRFPIVFQARI